MKGVICPIDCNFFLSVEVFMILEVLFSVYDVINKRCFYMFLPESS